jgi:hypothetical protein
MGEGVEAYDYEALGTLAKALGRPVSSLIVLAAQNDPGSAP